MTAVIIEFDWFWGFHSKNLPKKTSSLYQGPTKVIKTNNKNKTLALYRAERNIKLLIIIYLLTVVNQEKTTLIGHIHIRRHIKSRKMNNVYKTLNNVQTHLITWGNPFNCDGRDVIVCITGNPGVPDFYIEFASTLHSSTGLPICVIGKYFIYTLFI